MYRCIALVMIVVPTAAFPASAPIVIQQNSAHNIARVIQEQSSVISINHAMTVTQGNTTVTEIVDIGPDAAPVAITQSGSRNEARAFQQDSSPTLDLQQNGSVNKSWVIQREMP